MKINEKNLCSFATSATPVDREGYLDKRGEVNRSFQRRWFVLKGNLLFYFDRRGDKEPVGVIVLEGCTIELAEEDDQYSFKIVFHSPGGRSYTLCADTQDGMEQWMKALACAGYDYMKLMVAELQRQLDEMEEAATSTAITAPAAEPAVPPRGLRYNPFNRSSDSSGKSVPGSRHNKQAAVGEVVKGRMSFRELHAAYGRRILADRNEWRLQRLKLQQRHDDQPSKEPTVATLISL